MENLVPSKANTLYLKKKAAITSISLQPYHMPEHIDLPRKQVSFQEYQLTSCNVSPKDLDFTQCQNGLRESRVRDGRGLACRFQPYVSTNEITDFKLVVTVICSWSLKRGSPVKIPIRFSDFYFEVFQPFACMENSKSFYSFFSKLIQMYPRDIAIYSAIFRSISEPRPAKTQISLGIRPV